MVSWKEVMVGFHQLSPNGDPDAKLRLVYSVSIILKWKERGPKGRGNEVLQFSLWMISRKFAAQTFGHYSLRFIIRIP